MLDAGDAGDLLDEGWSEALAGEEGGDERGVIVPESETVAEDVEAFDRGEGAELGGKRGRRRAKRLVGLAGRSWGWRTWELGSGDGTEEGWWSAATEKKVEGRCGGEDG